jgi:hypothetical protein
VKAMIAAPAKALARIYPQMSQMFTDEEKHLCSSVTSVDEISAPELRRKLAGTMTKAGRTRKLKRTPSLKTILRDPDWLEEIWEDAISAATAETGLDAFPEHCPWEIPQVLDADWMPE